MSIQPFKLTSHSQYSHLDNDGAHRNYKLYFLNDVLILKQKIPFDERYDRGYDRKTYFYDEYILNGRLHQKRSKWFGCSHPDNDKQNVREVSYPLSKKILSKFNIPKDLRIDINN